jgi:predicted nucleic acid-binding Zn ribbon protein
VQPISASLDKIKFDLLRQLPEAEAAREAWTLVCGSSVASKTQVTGFESGVLSIRVPSREWRAELQGLRGHYLERLAKICPAKINELRFTTE